MHQLWPLVQRLRQQVQRLRQQAQFVRGQRALGRRDLHIYTAPFQARPGPSSGAYCLLVVAYAVCCMFYVSLTKSRERMPFSRFRPCAERSIAYSIQHTAYSIQHTAYIIFRCGPEWAWPGAVDTRRPRRPVGAPAPAARPPRQPPARPPRASSPKRSSSRDSHRRRGGEPVKASANQSSLSMVDGRWGLGLGAWANLDSAKTATDRGAVGKVLESI
eukprot:9485095-Pyramimonas_sp.AAC.1